MHRRRDLLIAGIALAVAAAAAVAIAAVSLSDGTSTTNPSTTPAAAGETIFRTGAFDGRPIPRTGSSGGGMMGGGATGGGMMSGGCANCHGSDGRGRTMPTFTAPNITYANLTDPSGMVQPDGSRGPTYTDAGIRTAVTQGIDPTGAHLAQPMPQWQLTDQEWAALLPYLKTLR
jgi:mono/diheme cytochrome c family protein